LPAGERTSGTGEEARTGRGIDRVLLGLAILVAAEVLLLTVLIFAVFLPNLRKRDAARDDLWADIPVEVADPSETASSPASGGPAAGETTDAASASAGPSGTEPGGEAGASAAASDNRNTGTRYVPTRMRGYEGVRVRISRKTGMKELIVDPFPEDADDRPPPAKKKKGTRK